MITVRIKGGLGNQLFQYAAAYAMAKRLNTSLEMDVSFFGTQSLRGYKLDNLQISTNKLADPTKLPTLVKIAKEKHVGALIRDITRSHGKKSIIVRKNYRYLLESGSKVLEEIFHIDDEFIYLDGYFQTPLYFTGYENEIRKQFVPAYEMSEEYLNIKDSVSSSNSVAVHIRRGDVAAAKKQLTQYAYLLSERYYDRAISEIEKRITAPQFFFFSDDIGWVKENINVPKAHYFVSLHTDHPDIDELMLMKNCKHIITANSTFSWWAAWLNENENAIRIVPDKAYGNDFMIPEEWIKIPVE